MRGRILTFEAATGEGIVSGDDGVRYGFARSDVRSASGLSAGQQADFTPGADCRAQDVFILEARASALSGASSFDLGRVVQRTFTVIRENWLIFIGAAAILVGIPSIVAVWGQSTMLALDGQFSGVVVLVIGSILHLAGVYILQGMVMKAAINSFNGKSTRFEEAFDVGVKAFFPLLGLGIVAGLGMGLGFLLLIVPGVILAVMWSAAAPVLIAEKRGVFESLQRSRDLSRGYRWPIFGLLVVYVVLAWIIGAAVGGLSLATGGSFTGGTPNLWVSLITAPIINILSGVVAAAGAAAVYYELRLLKGGAGADDLASVFD